ncbi:MAG TPA: hypothetical protein VJ839_04065 [Candidatus Limnocylindria bacterium]|nr:hypothetical protein [Candidatus Limnocylindria bacterium]
MATLLWLAVGVLVALLTWVLPAVAIVGPLVVLALVIVGFLVPRDITAAGAKLGVGFGATYLVLFGPNVLRDPLSATGEAYLLFGGGLVILVLGLAAVVRNRLRRRREQEAAIAQL